MDGIHNFGSGVHVAWREPYFYDAGNLHNAIVPSPIAVDEAGQCELPDFIVVSSRHSCDLSDPKYEQKNNKRKWSCSVRCIQLS